MSFSPPASVSLRLPPDWLELDPRADEPAADLRRAVESRWAGHDLIGTDRLVARLAPPARELRRQGEEAYVVVVGLYTDVVPVAGSPDPLVVTAHAMLSMSPPVGSLDDVRRDLGEAAESVTLSAGPAVRLSGPVPIGGPDGPGIVHRRWYVVPVPGTDRVATLAFLTPNTELADVFNDVFDAVADSLTFGWKD